jgi:RNA polymerase sigma factor (sigma-70 family)
MNSGEKIWDDFRKGKVYALSDIYHHHVNMLFRYGKKFTHDDELIKDTIQDLFFDLIRTRHRLGDTDNINFYLMASFRRKLARRLNQKKTIVDYAEGNGLEAKIVYSAEVELIGEEEITGREEKVQKALAELSPRQREILFYRYSCDFDYEKICEIMKLEYDSARKQVSRALKAMRKKLSGSDLFLFFTGFFREK